MTHKIPPLVDQLGTLLDLTVVSSSGRQELRKLVDEWRGWFLLTDPDAFERMPGRARLFLVRGKLEATPGAELPKGSAYERWHDRPADRMGELEFSDRGLGYQLGRVERIGYKSDKWQKRRGRGVDYDHNFLEHDRYRGAGVAPKLWANSPHFAKASTAAITGGNFYISEGGIA